MVIKQLENCNIVIEDENGDIENILPFAFVSKNHIEKEYILISSKSDKEDERAGINLKFSDVTKVNETSFNGSSIDELLKLISTEISLTGNCCGCTDHQDDEPVTNPPVISEIDDVTLTLEDLNGVETISHTVVLDITDNDSTDFTTDWKLISGPGTSIENDNDFTFTEEGIYIYEVTVTDESGNIDTQQVEFDVLPYVAKFLNFSTSSNSSSFSFIASLKEDSVVNLTYSGDGIPETKETLNITTKLGYFNLDFSGNTGVVNVSISHADKFLELNVSSQKIITLDVANCVNLDSLKCYINFISTLDVSKNTALKHLDFGDNNFSEIDISNNIILEYLRAVFTSTSLIDKKQLTTLDVTNNILLKYLNFYGNNLNNIDLSNNTNLTALHSAINPLSDIDVSTNINLISFSCFNNNLTNLDVSKNINLNILEAYDNNISSIDLSKNSLLVSLHIQNNELTSLDLSDNIILEELFCQENNLVNLNVSKNSLIKNLRCYLNSLSILNLTNNTSLEYLGANNNDFEYIDLSSNLNLKYLYIQRNKLVSVNIKNGHSSSLFALNLSYNTGLKCVQVDNVGEAYNNRVLTNALSSFGVASGVYYSTSCPVN